MKARYFIWKWWPNGGQIFLTTRQEGEIFIADGRIFLQRLEGDPPARVDSLSLTRPDHFLRDSNPLESLPFDILEKKNVMEGRKSITCQATCMLLPLEMVALEIFFSSS